MRGREYWYIDGTKQGIPFFDGWYASEDEARATALRAGLDDFTTPHFPTRDKAEAKRQSRHVRAIENNEDMREVVRPYQSLDSLLKKGGNR